MKKTLLTLATVLALASCAKVSTVAPVQEGADGPIGFIMTQGNMVKANSALQKAGHYNFGVFAYKSTDKVNNVMADYLVGYNDDEYAYSAAGTTVGDSEGLVDGKSLWMYEGMGSAEYTGTYAGQRLNPDDAYASNVKNQYLRYWDKSAPYTCFYAYAPYTNTLATGKTISYVDGQAVGSSSDTYVMTIPNGTIEHGYNKADEFEYMYAWTKVTKTDYGHDVALNFNRLNAKVNIKFWEDIPGYNVRIVDLTPNYSVSAVPAINDGTSNHYGYKLGAIYTKNGAKIQFAPETAAAPTLKQYYGETTNKPITFEAPTAAKIGETRIDATPSTTTYYAIPKGSAAKVLPNDAINVTAETDPVADLAETGLTFHVSYELISDTGEVIKVKNATVFVPKTYTNWVANTHYTYIFKITTSSNGSTDSTDPSDSDVEDPEVPTEPALYPIVFDNCTVEDWAEIESEHIITEGTELGYHNVLLDKYSVEDGTETEITVTIEDNDKYKDHTTIIDYAAVTVTGPATTTGWYNSTTKIITVPADATAGVYTVTYTCPSSDVYANHPKSWSAKFYVSNAYTITTNLPAVGTNALAAAALRIIATKDGANIIPAAAELAIEYPVNVEKDKVKVEDGKIKVAQDATPGKYKLVYTITVDGAKVKVAEKIFEVVDYQPALTHSVVYLKGAPVVVKLGRTCGDENIWVDENFTDKITIAANGDNMDITVANDTPEGVRTVYYVVNQSDADSKTMYQCMFNVQNTYTMALSKNTLNTTVGAAGAAEYGTDYIDITSTKNGVADELSAATAAKYAIPALAAADYTIEFVPAVSDPATPAHIKLQVKKSVPAGNYTVVYTGQSDKKVEAEFVIQK